VVDKYRPIDPGVDVLKRLRLTPKLLVDASHFYDGDGAVLWRRLREGYFKNLSSWYSGPRLCGLLGKGSNLYYF